MKEYKDNIILYRFFAIMLVVLGHATFVFTDGWVFKMPENPGILVGLCKYIYTFHMPAFISISGYLFHLTIREKENNSVSLKSYVYKKTFRLLIPMMFVLIFWVMPVKLLTGYYEKLNCNSVKDAILFAFREWDLGHLWYLPVLFILDLLMFISYRLIEEKIVVSKTKTTVFMLILAVISTFYYLSDKFLPYLFGKIFKLLFFYLFGYFIRKEEINKKLPYKNSVILSFIGIQFLLIVFKAWIS